MPEVNQMPEFEERLEGHDQIREYLDPLMSRSYYFTKVRPRLLPILFERHYATRSRKNLPKVFTYKDLIQVWLIRARAL